MDFDDIRLYLGQTGELIPAADAEERVTNRPGLYSIHIDDVQNLPSPFSDYMVKRRHNMIYLGKAAESPLSKRLVENDLRHKGHGSFFRSLGAVLGYIPEAGSLADKKNKTNYRFLADDKRSIVQWINEHLWIRYLDLEPEGIAHEPQLIGHFRPVFNDVHNPNVLQELRDRRARCRAIACRRVIDV